MSTSVPAAAASPSGAIVVYVTVPHIQVAEPLAEKLVAAKLAACVNILPGVTTIYMCKGNVEQEEEMLLIIKTREELLTELTAVVQASCWDHKTEVIGLPILGGNPSYLQWLMDSTSRAATGAGSEGEAPAAGTS
ncbi:copper-binding protein CutA [Volvox carteri f. nagariensis]|uniref:Copper-binding protein CutA n=1 Tax=Volvox carteri f. nagariensis TaxID=3068 RepID=D8U4M3_VOLCA|nr:copper-binding protein CutA [Volvox carteri f. nagariensis]EFJ45215.1 copper-binding protein CutA [Volvox carteri f. nagariensis]|eukprot:XP_002953591.1 copper-binding protein CutA [Volvox carteri f. nagariensis]